MLFEQVDSFFENKLHGVPLSELKKYIEEITIHYREKKFFIIKNELYALAYALVRLPATKAAIAYVLSQISSSLLDPIQEIIDLGSGPGTFLSEVGSFPDLKKLALVEKNPYFVSFLKELTQKKEGVKIVEKDFTTLPFETTHSFTAILASYSLGEISPSQLDSFLQKLTNANADLVILIEPGTPRGFENLNKARTLFLSSSYFLVAPCSHDKKCPLEGYKEEKWCHFSIRLQRSKLHRFLKGASLGYEDEKISYLVLSKHPYKVVGRRILGTPHKTKAGIDLELCVPDQVEKLRILPSSPDFKKAKKLSWGDICF